MGICICLFWYYLSVGKSYMVQGEQENVEGFFWFVLENVDDVSEDVCVNVYVNFGFCYMECDQYKEVLELFDFVYEVYL